MKPARQDWGTTLGTDAEMGKQLPPLGGMALLYPERQTDSQTDRQTEKQEEAVREGGNHCVNFFLCFISFSGNRCLFRS